MPLYKVDIEMCIMVFLKDGSLSKAEEIAIENASEEFDNGIGTVAVNEVKDVDAVPKDWVECVPWGDVYTEKTCAEILCNKLKRIDCDECGSTPVMYKCPGCGNDYCQACGENNKCECEE